MYLSLKKQSVDAIDIPSLMHYLICVDKHLVISSKHIDILTLLRKLTTYRLDNLT